MLSRTSNKYAHIQVARSTYSIPTELATKTVAAKLFHDRVEVVHKATVVAVHKRSVERGKYISVNRWMSIIARLYERRSLIVTTNLVFGRWTEVFQGATAAAAVITRIAHYATILKTGG